MPESPGLRIDGDVEQPLELSFADFQSFPESEQVGDVSRYHPKRTGDAVTLNAILARCRPRASARFLTLHATRDDFAASVPLEAVRDEALLVYRLAGEPLPVTSGGPFRFLIRNPAACHTAELDDCANVKFVDRIELSGSRGRDTRPETDDDHEELHAGQG